MGKSGEEIFKELLGKEQQAKGAYLTDVENVVISLDKGTYSKRDHLCGILFDYVEKASLGNAIDLQAKDDEARFLILNQILSAKNAPLGKWPTKKELPLWQQVDLNLAIHKGSGDFYEEIGKAVATQKSQAEKQELLQELLASNLVEKASVLAQYDKPDDAFESFEFYHGPEKNHAYAEYPAKWHRIRNDKINEYSMLVAAKDEAWLSEVCKEMTKDERPMEHIAALFGNDEERKVFFENEIAPMVAAYRAAHAPEERLPKYLKAREAFLAQKKVVEDLQASLDKLQTDFLKNWQEDKMRSKNLREAEAAIEHSQKAMDSSKQTREPLLKERDEVKADLDEITKQVDEADAAAQEAKKEWSRYNEIVRTGFDKEQELRNSVTGLAKIFSKKKYDAAQEEADKVQKEAIEAQEKAPAAEKKMKELTAKYNTLAEQEAQIRGALDGLTDRISQLNKAINAAQVMITNREDEKEQILHALDSVKKERESILERWKSETGDDARVMLDLDFVKELFSDDAKLSKKRAGENPWLSRHFRKEREKLFVIAEDFQKAFLEASGCCMANLATLAQYWGDWKKDGEKITFHAADIEDTVPSLWQTLFLLVPMAAFALPTIASSFIDTKKPGLYGTVAIEGTDKLAPESVVGALYRGRNALIIRN